MLKSLSLLGMACRASKLCLGHDVALESVLGGNSHLVLLATDASENLKSEFRRVCANKGVTVLETEHDKLLLSSSLPKTVAVISVTDEGFSNRFLQLYKEGN